MKRDFCVSIAEPLTLPRRFSRPGCSLKNGKSPEKAGRAVLRKLKKRLRELESREAVLELATPERVRAEIAHMAFDDIGRYLYFFEGDKGFEVHARCSDEIDTRNISEVSVGTGGKVTLKLYSRERALLKLWDILRQDDGEEDDSLLDVLRGMNPVPADETVIAVQSGSGDAADE